MANNLFISHDLYNPKENYQQVGAAIRSLGDAIQVQYSLWYVKSRFDSSQARDIVANVIDLNDTIIIIDVTNRQLGMQHLKSEISRFVVNNFNK